MRRALAMTLAVALAACGADADSKSQTRDGTDADAGTGGSTGGGTPGSGGGGSTGTGGGDNPGTGGAGGSAATGGGSGGGTAGTSGTGGAPGCETNEVFFETRVYDPIMSRTCANCHIAGGAAGATRLVLPPHDAPDWIAQSLAAMTPLAEELVRDVPLLVAKPAGLHPGGHGGGTLTPPGSIDYQALANLATRLQGEDPCASGTPVDPPPPPDDPTCDVEPPGARSLRRLSHVEYAHTIHDLFGLEADALAPDRVVHGFDNNGAALGVTALLADQYRTSAERLATEVDLNRVLPCGEHTRDCAVSFARHFGRKMFRRPLTADELASAMGIYDLAAEDGFESGVRWVLTAWLQSPNFLYRTELGRREGDHFVLTPYEIAAELSYLFWQTTPDDTLLDLAATGDLLDPAVVAREAARMLADPRSAETMRRFTERWLGIDRLPIVTRDGTLFPALTLEIRAAMAEETSRFVTGLWTGGGTLDDLFRSTQRPLTPALAAYYGLPAPAADWAPVDVAGTPYAGVLTQGSVLVTHALPTTSSPIHRGLFVRERLLCQDLPDPPANLDTSPPAVDPSLSTRERYVAHSRNPACAGCHTLIDPIGFAFEHYDAAGRWRDDDGGHAIDAQGEIVRSPASDAQFDGVAELSAVLAGSDDVRACYLSQWVRYGFGVDDALPLGCYVNRLGENFEALHDILPALTGTTHFRERTGGDTELDVAGADLVPTAPGSAPEMPEPEVPPSGPPSEPPPPPGDDVTPGAVLVLEEVSRWQTGYCANAHVDNTTDAELQWVVAADIEGRINNLWNAERSADSGRVVFRGVQWNATLAPGQRAEFGYCADL